MELKYTLTKPDELKVANANGNVSFGCDQNWFGSYWKRQSGCGPTAATNLLLYLHKVQGIALPVDVDDKPGCISLMEAVWQYVTPSAGGVHLTSQLVGGVLGFAKANSFDLDDFSLNVPKRTRERPTLASVIRFVSEGLQHDCPVAFLNLSPGKVRLLDQWHWVTIVSLETDQQMDNATVLVYDGDQSFPVDLKLWYETTRLGGGFVYFLP